MNAIDLGLSIQWADCNLGAKHSEEYGKYFAWGEITEKNTYTKLSYKWYDDDKKSLTKYNISKDLGKIDKKQILELDDDAAFIHLNSMWRIPTYDEWVELYNNCIWTWTDDYNNTNIAGEIITSKINNNFIFLPAAGYHTFSYLIDNNYSGDYWANSISTDFSFCASGLYFDAADIYTYQSDRRYGFPIRPVSLT